MARRECPLQRQIKEKTACGSKKKGKKPEKACLKHYRQNDFEKGVTPFVRKKWTPREKDKNHSGRPSVRI